MPAGTAPVEPRIGILGGGLAGIAAAVYLRDKLGLSLDSVKGLERNPDFGGTWLENTYPGLSCDVPAHLYSFSWAMNPNWSRPYVPQPELLDYIKSVADAFHVRKSFTFNIKVTRAAWDDEKSSWTVWYKDMNKVVLPPGTTVPIWRALTDPMRDVPGATAEADEEKEIVRLVNALPEESFECDFLVNTTRFTGSPGLPRIPGALEGAFKGDQWHSMRWPENGLERVKGKRVAMIGCAAAAAQLVPQVVPLAKSFDLYHRTPNHFMHRPNDLYPEDLKKKFAENPLYFRMWRQDLDRKFCKNWWETGFLDGEEHKWSTEDAKANLYENIKDEKLREALWPDFPAWCRRVCFHNDFYPALAQPHVTVILDRIVKMDATGIVTAAQNAREEKIDESAPQTHHDYDVIIYATGWAVDGNKEPLVTITGRGGADIVLKSNNIKFLGMNPDGTPNLDMSEFGPFSYFAGMVEDMPNYFSPGSPPIGLCSVISVIEDASDYMIKIIKHCLHHNIKAISPKHEAIAQFYEVVDERCKKAPYYRGTHHTYHKQFRPDGSYVTRIHFPGSPWEFAELQKYPVFANFEEVPKAGNEPKWAIPTEPVGTPWDDVYKAVHVVAAKN
ncbi:hypothetical protein DFJ74DRAFT_702499 [Hyaloraphidium curvatum]|nr:hypothetical protein DFJ74DRAFT_702499 [Hyaloraphidium curvatum]